MKLMSIKDQLPEEDGDVICYFNGWFKILGYTFFNGFFDLSEEMELIDMNKDVTHWMPLPEPPKQ